MPGLEGIEVRSMGELYHHLHRLGREREMSAAARFVVRRRELAVGPLVLRAAAAAAPRERRDGSSPRSTRAGPKGSDPEPGELPHHVRHALAAAGYPRPAIDVLDPLEVRARRLRERHGLDLEAINSKLLVRAEHLAGRSQRAVLELLEERER